VNEATIAALYVETGGCYFDLPGVIVAGHGEDHADGTTTVHLDGRDYRGPWPVVAHPSCKRFGRFWHGSTRRPHQFRMGDDGGCFEHALWAVRAFGGVIEHPADSRAWGLFNLNRPTRGGGWIAADMVGGYTCYVEQGHYGHPSRKPTWLYVAGIAPADLPELEWSLGEQRIPQEMIDRYGYEKARRIGVVAMMGGKDKVKKRNRSPLPFRDLLISIARSAHSRKAAA